MALLAVPTAAFFAPAAPRSPGASPGTANDLAAGVDAAGWPG